MLRKKPKFSKEYLEGSFHEYGISRLIWSNSLNDAGLPEEEKLARLGAKLAVAIDRFEYAGFRFDAVTAAHRLWNAAAERTLIEAADGEGADEAALEELRTLLGENARCLDFDEHANGSAYEEYFELAEHYVWRWIRMKVLFSQLGQAEDALREHIRPLILAYASVAERLEYLALRHFYKSVQAKAFQPLAAICIGGELFRTAAALLELYLLAEDRVETREARASILLREYPIASICALGRDFDFDVFGEEETSPLMAEVVDLLSWS